MFDEPDELPSERARNPLHRAKEKFDEFRMHAELAAIFEGKRKFDARILPKLDPQFAREIQQAMGRLEKARPAENPLLPASASADAKMLLGFPTARSLSLGDYHIYHRPGEAMIARFLAGEQVESFYQRFQAHFEAALWQYREEERQSLGWKQDPQTTQYLDALDKIDVRMSDRYLRDAIRKLGVYVLSTQAADEMDILHLADYLMGASPQEIVGPASAPPDDGATENQRAWFFKLFSLRGVAENVEQMCFFAYLQKSDDFSDSDW